MVKKKRKDKSPARKKKVAAKRTSGSRAMRRSKKTASKKATPGRKAVGGKAARNRAPVRKAAAKKKAAVKKTSGKRTARVSAANRDRERTSSRANTPTARRGIPAEASGQSGDSQGLSRAEIADSESVEELLEEGQSFEAGVVSGVENAPDADKGGVRTRQVPEDDVPQEYLDED